MKVLVIGSGGREHAIAEHLSLSPNVFEVVICPGNPGMVKANPKLKIQNISATDCEALCHFAKQEKIDLTIVGPEASLSLGVVDLFRENNLAIVGSSKVASMLETSKAFAKKIMNKAQVPTAGFQEFFKAGDALSFINSYPFEKMVVKCDGLAAGKGVVVCQSKTEAVAAVNALMNEALLGENIDHIIIEDFLEGVEVSAFALCDQSGESFIFLGTACDHKRLRDGDLGPNTGGMGVFSPAKIFNSDDEAWVNQFVFAPMLKTMKENGTPFSGILFAGLMKTTHGWSVLEFNVRLGDPETQVLLPLIDEDLVPWFLASANGTLKDFQNKVGVTTPKKKNLVGVHVVMAAHGYPGTEGVKVRSGDSISLDDNLVLDASNSLYFAGVKLDGSKLQTSGGRVLGVTSLAPTYSLARKQAYERISQIHFEGAQYRADIASEK